MLRTLIWHNGTLKVFSFVFACGLWVFVNAGARDTEKTLTIPIELRNLPPQLVVIGSPGAGVELRVMGPRTLLGRLGSEKITLNLSGVRQGHSSFRVSADQLGLPRGVKVVRISPSQINLEIARVVKRAVPVRADVVGKPPHGYVSGEVEIVPDTIEITGPAPYVRKLNAVMTDPIYMERLTRSITREVNLREPEEQEVTYSLNQVRIRVEVQEVLVAREFPQVKIAVKNAAFRAEITPSQTSVSVYGPQRLVEQLQFRDGAVFVDAAGHDPGTVTVPVNVLVPPGIEVMSREPAEVALRLERNDQEKTPEQKRQAGKT